MKRISALTVSSILALTSCVVEKEVPADQNSGDQVLVYEGPFNQGTDATVATNSNENEDEDDFFSNDLILDESEDDEDINEVLPKCGVDDLADEDLIRFSQKVDYSFVRTVEAGYFDIFIDIKATIELINKKAGLDFIVTVEPEGVNFDLKDHPAYDDIQPVIDQAKKEVKQFAGIVTSDALAQNSTFNEEWKGVVCTIPGAKSFITTRDGYRTKVEFSPGIPPAISPIADRERYEIELGKIKHFPEITATVVETNNPRLKVGQVIMGSVIIEEIPAEKTSPDGRSHVKGDVAYRVTNNFGTRDQTLDLGFHLWNEYYIDFDKKLFAGVFADVGGPNLQYFVAE